MYHSRSGYPSTEFHLFSSDRTRRVRGEVRKKSKKSESQEARDSREAERRNQRASATMRRKEKEEGRRIKSRKEDVSQLVDLRITSIFGGSGLSV